VTRSRAPLERKLAAILYADVAGYSRLTEADEEGTHRLLSESLDRITDRIEHYNGKVQHYAGDAVLAEFPSVTLAVICALAIQRELSQSQAHLPEEKRTLFRIGINLGEVIVDRGEIYGEGVNVAARLEALADPGSVWISDIVRHELRDKLPLDYTDLGEHSVKNIAEPVRAFRVEIGQGATLPPVQDLVPRRKRALRPYAVTAASIAVLVLASALAWFGMIAPEPTAELALPDKPSLAVLPFKNLNRDEAQEYFVDGMTDDLITDFSKNPDLFVIASNSSSRYKNTSMGAKQIAQELGVRYILTGMLRRTPEMLRLNTQLIDARSGGTLWADRYDADMEQIFQLQSVIVAQVMAKLLSGTSPQEELAKRKGQPTSVEAYDLYLQGWAHYNRETPEGYSDAIPLLQAAVEQDPSFLRPHAVLAAIYYQGRLRRWHREWELSEYDAFRKAYEHLEKSMSQPTALALSVSSLMHIHNGRHQSAISEAQRAIAVDANDPTAHIVMAHALAMSGKGKSSLEYSQRAIRLNPHYPASYVWIRGLAHFVDGDYGQARESFEEAGTDHPGLDLVPLLATYGILGREADVKTLLEMQHSRWEQWHPGHPMTVRSLIAEFPPFLREVAPASVSVSRRGVSRKAHSGEWSARDLRSSSPSR